MWSKTWIDCWKWAVTLLQGNLELENGRLGGSDHIMNVPWEQLDRTCPPRGQVQAGQVEDIMRDCRAGIRGTTATPPTRCRRCPARVQRVCHRPEVIGYRLLAEQCPGVEEVVRSLLGNGKCGTLRSGPRQRNLKQMRALRCDAGRVSLVRAPRRPCLLLLVDVDDETRDSLTKEERDWLTLFSCHFPLYRLH